MIFPGIDYSIGKVLNFQRTPLDEDKNVNFFKRGSSNHCSYSALEEWKILYKPEVSLLPGVHLRELILQLPAVHMYIVCACV